MSERVFLVELNYQVSPIHLREQLSSRRLEAEKLLRSELQGKVFMVATCHRITVLGYVSSELDLIHPLQKLLPDLKAEHLLILSNREAVKHWFSTACGLNSRTIGEHEILGQVRNAFSKSENLTPEISELVKRAIHTGKRARTETRIGRYATSLTAITKNRIEAKYQNVHALRVMLFGTGEMSRLVLQMLKGLSVNEVLVVSKDLDRAAAVCKEPNMRPIPLEQFDAYLAGVDVVIGATWTNNFLVVKDHLKQDVQQLYIDLGMPRNFDPELEKISTVELADLNDLNETVETAKRKRNEEVKHVEQIILQEVSDLENWLKFRSLIPEIRSLRAEVDALRDRCCMRIHQELFYLSAKEKKKLCYDIRGLAQQHFSKIVEVLKSDMPCNQKVTAKLETLHELYDAVDEIWHDFFAHGEKRVNLLEVLEG